MREIFTILILSMLLLSVGLVSAHEHNFGETKQLIDSGIGCDKLTDEQLESIGEYYMEQMHPGEAHELMDNMMGGGMGFGFIFMLLFWGLIIWFIVTLISANQSNKNEPDSLTILNRRYASGEITKRQYEEMKKELRR